MTKRGRRAKLLPRVMHHVMMDTGEIAHLHRLMGGKNNYPPISESTKNVMFKWFTKEVARPMPDWHITRGVPEL